METRLFRRAQDPRGQDLIEYALTAGLLAVVITAMIPGIALSVAAIFNGIGSALSPISLTASSSQGS